MLFFRPRRPRRPLLRGVMIGGTAYVAWARAQGAFQTAKQRLLAGA